MNGLALFSDIFKYSSIFEKLNAEFTNSILYFEFLLPAPKSEKQLSF